MLMENKFLNVAIIAGNVHQLRQAANLSQSELAKLIHVSKSSINAWERAQHSTSKNSDLISGRLEPKKR